MKKTAKIFSLLLAILMLAPLSPCLPPAATAMTKK